MKKTLSVKSYTLPFVIERDSFPNGKRAYRAYIPELESLGASSWGYSKDEAIRNLQEVARMVVEELAKERRPILYRTSRISSRPLVTVTT